MKARILLVLVITLGLVLAGTWVASADRDALGEPLFLGNQVDQVASPSTQMSTLPYTRVVMATSGEPEILDPALSYETAGGQIIQQVYEPLLFYRRESTTEFIPMLATDWTISEDGLTYVFNIRSGVKFHNGNGLSAEDVAYTFQRGLLQGGTASPQWLLSEPFFGAGVDDVSLLVDPSGALYDDRNALTQAAPAVLQQACQTVKQSIISNDAAGVVTMTLKLAWGPMLHTLAGTWGSIMDKEWVISNGGWDGSCDTWQNYYAMNSAEDPFTAIANGTGPYMLDHWTHGVEVGLARNPQYWRTTPMWEGGPSGLAAIEQVTIKLIPDITTSYQMLVDGEVDFASISIANYRDALNSRTLLRYDTPDGLVGNLVYPTGTLKAYVGGLGTNATDVFFNYHVYTTTEHNYIGSGALDGEGIPPDFFNDLHVRKGFNYAFNWDQYIQQIFNGDAIQRRGPIIAGILGYTDTQPTYFYSPTLALQELSQAWGGDVINNGFVLTITYNTGNATRRAVCEILKAGIEALDPKFKVNVLGLDWQVFLPAQRAQVMPIFISGWLQDIPHPHNWLVPYLMGTFGSRQSLPPDQQDGYRGKIYACLSLAGAAAQACYEDIQNTTYLNATDIFLAQSYAATYVRAELRGYYLNLALPGVYFYVLSKGPLPVVQTVLPGAGSTVPFSSTSGSTGILNLPAGSVSQTLEIVIEPDTGVMDNPAGFQLGGLAFDIQAYQNGNLLAGLVFSSPIMLEIHYTPDVIRSLDESDLRLFWWNGSSWDDAACGLYVRDLDQDILGVPICHLSRFALGGPVQNVYLPLTYRSVP